MSPIHATSTKVEGATYTIASTEASDKASIQDIVQSVQQRIAPVWPLKDYVAVNPYSGFAAKEFLSTREYLRTLSDLELFMPVNYYRQQHAQGSLHRTEISAAVDELVADGVEGAERIDVNQVVALLQKESQPGPTADAEFTKVANPNRTLHTVAEFMDRQAGSNWCALISDEISKQCASPCHSGCMLQ